MKTKIFLIASMAVLLAGCRQESDALMNYAYNDQMAFGASQSSFAAEFDVMWSGLSTNYALWDFEYKENPDFDWDKVYETYRPKFEALDSIQNQVTDAQLQALLDSVVAPLHDGHMAVMLYNHGTGKFVASSPGQLRVKRERGEEYSAVSSRSQSLAHYEKAGDLLEYKAANSYTILTVAFAATSWFKEAQERLAQIPESDRTQEQKDSLAIYTQIYTELVLAMKHALLEGDMHAAITEYNIVVYRYEYMHFEVLKPIDEMINNMGLNITYALFKGNIAYLAFDGFKLSAYLDQMYIDEIFGACSESTLALVKEVGDVWRAWFNAIQAHSKAQDLGGVIIDIRSNGGGFLNDYKYVIGALVPSGGLQDCNGRFKRGTGRFDYSPLVPQIMPTYDSAHVTVTEPVVVLCNCASVSMAEHTSYGAKLLENGTLIGTRTWGGFSALSSAETYTNNYAGYVGIQGETPVFCYVPQEVAITMEGEIVEGKGIVPDIEIAFDVAARAGGEGPDNQLDRALQFIRTGH